MAKKRKKAKKKPPKAARRRKKNNPTNNPTTPRPPGRPPDSEATDWAEPFFCGLLEGLHVRDACAKANVDHTTAYRRRREEPEFRKLWREAVKIGTRELESEASRRAYHGTLKPVYQAGALVGYIREYSDALMQFLLKGRKPNKYRDNSKLEIGGTPGKPVEVIEIVRSKPKAEPNASDPGSAPAAG